MVQKNKSLTIVRDIRNGDWYWISRKVYSDYTSKIGVIGLALYNAYASHAIEKENVFPSQKRLAETLGITTPTIVKYNKILENNGLIKIESGKEKGDVNIVYLLKLKGIKQVKTPSKPGLDQGINEVKSEKEKEEKEKTKDITILKEIVEGVSVKQFNDLIEKFRPVNPACDRLFGNKTERDALERLIKKNEFKKIEKIIEALPKINMRPYAPRITTPYQLEKKFGELLIFIQKELQKGPKFLQIR